MAYHFNSRIEIIKEVEGDDDFLPGGGGTVDKTIAKPWADVRTIKGSEYADLGTTVNEYPIRFIIRYREGIENAHFVKYGKRKYNIKSVTNDNGRNQTLTIFAISKFM
ncbi:phage head closure protein [Staphylococcus massiliensis]|uniref:Phage head-tail adaptor n=1 Tax=Staphylococcus massiliensis S46 TaxID=1229783 RepID=K9AS20_9STAP|nr:phage head closure protein [Staphylococcus massiliensis]EKU45382.1 phage head-tail adaptor [Staphylococcus massiliensis S46]